MDGVLFSPQFISMAWWLLTRITLHKLHTREGAYLADRLIKILTLYRCSLNTRILLTILARTIPYFRILHTSLFSGNNKDSKIAEVILPTTHTQIPIYFN
jgi:hypothetical protein